MIDCKVLSLFQSAEAQQTDTGGGDRAWVATKRWEQILSRSA
ncbi:MULTISPECIES: hypothetical protein [Bradyrhizobium]|nr:hypothetical protein [Bradyrhizobium zhengyangense]